MIAAIACLLVQVPTVKLVAVGDIMLGRWVEKRLIREGPEAPWRKVDELLMGADIRFGNLECVLSTRAYATKNLFKLRARPDLAVGLKGRWTVLSVANNHSLDCGPEGLADTVRLLREWKIEPVGLAGQPVILKRDGLKVAFLGYSEFRYPGIGDLATWKEDVASMRPKVDCLVVSIHWGDELASHPRRDQEQLSQEMHAAGVDLVLGHHPHVLQPGIRDGEGFTAFSMGDFVFDSPAGERRKTGVSRFTLKKGSVRYDDMLDAKITRYFPQK